jgi:uncharacterized membrane protein YdjX (TVP38/TMEM64 family)
VRAGELLREWALTAVPATLSTAGLLAALLLYAGAVPFLPAFVVNGLAAALFSFYLGFLLGSLAALLARGSPEEGEQG